MPDRLCCPEAKTCLEFPHRLASLSGSIKFDLESPVAVWSPGFFFVAFILAPSMYSHTTFREYYDHVP